MKNHVEEAHSFILEKEERCPKKARSIYTRSVIVGFLAFLAMFISMIILLPVEGQYLALLGFAPIIALAFYGSWLSEKEMKPYHDAVTASPHFCHYCGDQVSRDGLRAHVRFSLTRNQRE